MKIIKATHKALLSILFYEEVGVNPVTKSLAYKAKQFPFTKLFDATSAAKKLAEGSTEKDGRTYYKDGVIELTPAEVAILKELFDANKDKWDITVAETIKELQELFKEKK
ncbi:MAG: hypothetical protein HY427_03480 [Candidatus Levybacteria bacterium]|nr:hypothetical protein [Candidatus Levybacteria bacterium]